MVQRFFKVALTAGVIGAAVFFAPINFSTVEAAGNTSQAVINAEWYWLSSDSKYSKFFDPNSVKVVKKAMTDSGKEIPTEIEAWTKTTYSYEGAAETIRNYEISSILSDPKMLSYSLALLRINPQNRTIQYAREDFYNSDNKVIWSKADGRIKEINSQSFDEDFYASIVDEVFKHGEMERKNAKDRWIELWTYSDEDGSTTNVTADTTTMQLKGTNLIVWEWQETKNSVGQVVEIRFMKKAVNLPQGTERLVRGEVWTPSAAWQDIDDEFSGTYRMIRNDEPNYKGLIRLRAFAKGYSTWVSRYSIS